ncbi:acetyl-CoA synthetase-like protein [Lojkania enalia]|uniref:Acetyl-CoA synthetase-like protein n=1 Tax=Lojkania enalia TaxID=147567 RepID=A0A9P4JXA0_9PLEO|nr:acetyl-CoA synthetase-like protein [Didymosphaeria enalia]
MVNEQGRRLVASTINAQAQSHPDNVYFSIPKNDNNLSEGFLDISCSKFSNAIDHAAIWLQANIGPASAEPFGVIAYQGPNDLRYPILAVAAAKVSKQILFPFSLAPPPVKLHLLQSTRCEYLLHPAYAQEQVRRLLSDSPHIRSIVVPELNTWLNADKAPAFSYRRSWDEGKDDPWLIFHTSGTTGLPRPITYTNRMMTSFDIAQGLPEPKDQTQLGWHINRRCYGVAPLSHFSGMCAALQAPTFLRMVSVQGPATKPPTPLVVADTLRYSGAEGFVSLPFLLRAMVQQSQTLELLKDLEYIQWIGAALDTETGNMLSQHVKLCPAMGTTECGPYFLSTVDGPQDWAYYAFQSGQGIEFVERTGNLYELVFKKRLDAVWQQVFIVYPNIDEYETKDLFRKHPGKEGLWAYVGRSDDVVVLSNSANINAAAVEEKIMKHPNIQMALVGGSGLQQSFAIIELNPAASEEFKEKGPAAALDAVWPAVEEANHGLSDYTRLRKKFVIVTSSERGLVKSAKGSVMRGPSLKVFEKDVEGLFAGGE